MAGFPEQLPSTTLGGGSTQTEAAQRANGAYCAGRAQQSGPTIVPSATALGPAVYALFRQANTQCPVNP